MCHYGTPPQSQVWEVCSLKLWSLMEMCHHGTPPQCKPCDTMFVRASKFNADVSLLNVSSVQGMYRMFGYASKFNRNFSSWEVHPSARMNWMFKNTSSFNQDLCACRDKFDYGRVGGMFSGSNCTFQDDPKEDDRGPFCASSCTNE